MSAREVTAESVRKSYWGEITGSIKDMAFYTQATENFLNGFSGVG